MSPDLESTLHASIAQISAHEALARGLKTALMKVVSTSLDGYTGPVTSHIVRSDSPWWPTDHAAIAIARAAHLHSTIAQKWAAVIGHGSEALQSKGDTLRYTNLAIALLQEARDAALELEGPQP